MARAGKSKAAILYCSEVEACYTWNYSLQGGAAQRSGTQLVYTAQVSLAQPDFTAECLQAQSHGAEAILAAVDANSLVRLGRSCAQQNYHPMYIAVSLAVIDSVATDPNLQGLVAPQGTFPWPANDTPLTQAYQHAIHQYAPGLRGSGASSSVWPSGMLMLAVTANLPANSSSQDIFNGLWTIKNNTLGGLAPPLTYNQGQGAAGSACYFLVEVQGGKWTAPKGSQTSCL
jgi:branched-chain amino acid transport system substrate-binding protein